MSEQQVVLTVEVTLDRKVVEVLREAAAANDETVADIFAEMADDFAENHMAGIEAEANQEE